MAKITLTAPITDLSGTPIENMTLGSVCALALLNVLPGDEGATGQTKAKLFTLALDLHGKDEAELKVEDVALLKERIGRAYPPLVVGRAWQLLDPSGT